MIRLTAADLRNLADKIENREKYDNMSGVVYVTLEHHPNGREFLQFEQPCSYADCNSYYYRYDSK